MEQILEFLGRYGWQPTVVAIITLFLVELTKSPMRKLVKKDGARHSIYIVFNTLFCIILSYLLLLIPEAHNDMYKTGYGLYLISIMLVNTLYPIIEVTGFWKFFESIFGKVLKYSVYEVPKEVPIEGKNEEISITVEKSDTLNVDGIEFKK